MGNIRIKSLAVDTLSDSALESGHLYKDLALDLSNAFSYNNQLNKKEFIKDVASLYDLEAVKNSIKNAFLTAPGQNILNPLYGVDLRQFIFEPVDDFTAEIIQELIESGLPRMEPRAFVSDVKVIGDEDAQQYDISLTINIPSLNLYGVSIKSILNSTGYTIL